MSRGDFAITSLALEHEAAITDYVADFGNAGESEIHGYFGRPEWSHVQTIAKLQAWERGDDLDDWVANSTRFLIEKGRILGNYNLRHQLTESLRLCGGHCGYSVRPSERQKGHATLLLSHAKNLARERGIQRMLVTCAVDNIGSAKTIKNNGGILQDVIQPEDSDLQMARYWIAL